MSHRKIVVNGKNYFYKVGRKNVEIRDEVMCRLATPTLWDFKGISEDDFIEARKAVSCFNKGEYIVDRVDVENIKNASVVPSDIEKYIKQNNL